MTNMISEWLNKIFTSLNKFSVFEVTSNWLNKNNITFESHKEIGSTNSYAKQKVSPQSNAVEVFIADTQSAGRGRGTNTWLNSLSGHNLICTWSLDLKKSPQPITGPLLGLALYRSFKNTWNHADFYMKAPNDIYLNDKKLCGVLTESLQLGSNFRLIVGVGVNVFSCPSSLVDATFLAAHLQLKLKDWYKFYEHLHSEILKASHDGQGLHLTLHRRDEMLAALNANKKLNGRFVSISPYGDLATESKTISWRDL